MAIRFNLNDENVKTLWSRTYQNQGIFDIDRETGKIFVGRRSYTDLNDALRHIETSGIKSYHTFQLGERLPNMGAGRYAFIEEMMKTVKRMLKNPDDEELQGLAQNLKIERYGYKGDIDSVRNLYEDLMRKVNGVPTSFGIDRPGLGDSPHVALRFYSGTKELTSAEIKRLFDRIGISFEGAWDEEPVRHMGPKAAKRFNTLLDYHDHSIFGLKSYKTHVMDVSDEKWRDLWHKYHTGTGTEEEHRLFEAYDAAGLNDMFENKIQGFQRSMAFDGISIGNPALLKGMVDQMKGRARLLMKDPRKTQLGIEMRQQGRSLMEKAEELERRINRGGSYETFRALGLEDLEGKFLPGMAKGDIIFPGLKGGGWENIARLLGVENPEDLHFILGGQQTKEMAFGIYDESAKAINQLGEMHPGFTLKMNEPNKMVFADIESSMAFPELYDLDKMAPYTRSVISAKMQRFLETRQLPEDLEEAYKNILAKEFDADEGNILSVMDQKARAQMMIEKARLGIDPKQDEAYAKEAYNSMVKFLKPNKRHTMDPHFLAPGTIGAHIRPSFIAEHTGFIDYTVEEGELGFSRKLGILMSPTDISKAHALFGGFDLDDLLRAHTYMVEGELRTIGIRNPLATGETAAFKWHPGAYGELAQQLAVNNPQIADRAKLLQLRENMNKLSQDTNEAVLELEAAQRAHADSKELKSLGNQADRMRYIHAKATDEYNVYRNELAHKLGKGIRDMNAIKPEDLIKEISPTMSKEKFEIFDTLSKFTGPQEIPVIKSPIYSKYLDWLQHSDTRFKPSMSLPLPSADFTAADLGMEGMAGMDELVKAFREMSIPIAKVKGVIGQYRNVDIVSSTLRAQIDFKLRNGGLKNKLTGEVTRHEEGAPGEWAYVTRNAEGKVVKGGKEFGILPYESAEDIADVLTQGIKAKSGLNVENVMERISGMLFGMAEAASTYDIKFSRGLFEDRLGGAEGGGKMLDKFQDYFKMVAPDRKYESIFLNPHNALEKEWDYWSRASESFHTGVTEPFAYGGEESLRYFRQLSLPKGIAETSFSSEEIHEASKIASAIDLAHEQLTASARDTRRFNESWDNKIMEKIEAAVHSSAAVEGRKAMNKIEGFWDEEGVLTERGRRIMNAYRQQFGGIHTAITTRADFADIALHSQIHAETQGGARLDEMVASGEITEEQLPHYKEILKNVPRRPEIHNARFTSYDEGGEEAFEKEYLRRIEESPGPGAIRNKNIREAMEAGEDVIKWHDVAPTPFKLINKEEIMKLLEKPGVKGFGIGLGALIAGSLIYRRVRDRSPEELQGPALLPGGSPYENYPSPQLPAPLMSRVNVPRGRGITYKVIARGNYDEGDLRSQAEGITGTPSSGTIYNTRNLKSFNNPIPDAINQAYGGSGY